MDNPEYILVDEIGNVVTAVKTVLALPSLNYHYGYQKELNQTLVQQGNDPGDMNILVPIPPVKYPLIWLMQPLEISRGVQGYWGIARNLRIFIFMESDKESKAAQRMTNNFKPIMYPIYREFLKQLDESVAFASMGVENMKHKLIDRYWAKELGLDDTVDILEISGLELFIHRNLNCTPSN